MLFQFTHFKCHYCMSLSVIMHTIKCLIITNIYSITELEVEFSLPNFVGIEATGIVPVTLLLKGGASASNISVIVLPSDQSPVSAEGKRCISCTLPNYGCDD